MSLTLYRIFKKNVKVTGLTLTLERPLWMDRKTYDELPAVIYMRELKKGKNIIATPLLDVKEYSKNELFELYEQRWQIELDF